jgi:hypothetical protein
MVSESEGLEFEPWSCIFLLCVILVYRSSYGGARAAHISGPPEQSGRAITDTQEGEC